MADGLRDVAGLPDPVGEVVRGSTLANGLELRQVRVPFGVVGIIYEARPNVTADAAGICLKSGNAVLLRGSSSARRSNEAIVAALREAVGLGGPARRRGAARAGGGARGRQGAHARPRPRRRAHPARRRRADPLGRRRVHGAGHRDRGRQLPRVRRRARRPRHGAGHRAQRQDPPAVGVQRRRVAARARGRRRRLRARASSRALQEAGVTVHGDASLRRPRGRRAGDRRGLRRRVPLARHLRGRRTLARGGRRAHPRGTPRATPRRS